MLVAWHVLAFFVEAPLLACSERVSARWFSSASLAVIAISSFAAALAPPGIWLFVALALYGPAAGCALSIAEGLLVLDDPSRREKTMARAALAANAGDLAVPIALAVFAWLGLGWRAGFVAGGVFASVLAIVHGSSRSLDRVVKNEDEAEGSIRDALRARGLLAWSLACTSTSLLDEVLVAFAALRLHDIGASATERAFAIAAWVMGGFVGLAAVERFIEESYVKRALLLASIATAAFLLLLVVGRSPIIGIVALFGVGVFGSTLHPLTKARCYAALPNRPAIVNALASALLPLEIVAPIVLAIVAARAGNGAAVLCLLVAPISVALVSRLRE
jgi:hypothetical protein